MSVTVILSIEEEVAEIRFNRPNVLNAPDIEVAEQFEAAVNAVLAEATNRVVILSGSGRAFMAGGDLGAFRAATRQDRARVSRRILEPLNRALEALASSALITIASVHGAVAGAGMSLAMMTDFAVAAESTKFSFSYTKVAGCPDCGGSFALTRLVGLRKALEIALLSDVVDARTALSVGLVNRVVPDEELRSTTLQLAQRLRSGPRQSLGSTKRLLRQSSSRTLPEQLSAELENFAALSGAADFQEGIDAFYEKRAPRFMD